MEVSYVGVRIHVRKAEFGWYIGFGLCGTPDTLINALSQRKDVGNLTAVSNNVGSGEKGLGMFERLILAAYTR